MSLLTIITVTWNCATTLEKTLRSVQDIKNETIEYIIIDGVSDDGTLDLISQYASLVDQMVSEPDTGIYNAMNKGVSLAKGEYILFINGDDELVSEGFPSVLQVLKQGKADIVCGTTLVGSVNAPTEVLTAQPLRLPFFNTVPHPSSFTRTALLKATPFREDLRIASDYDFFLGAYLRRKHFQILPAVTALHQRGGASGDQDLSETEIEQIRHDQLGWRYPLYNTVGYLYRSLKNLTRQPKP
ncbi:glycosyltransferase family 2 protein [Kiloniella sp.]|uniref:glycosyltransferase family 2 protein n=1 Tax=Kiloniella sp. TaxID=1938587 RepID=UPI003B01C5AE